MLLVALTSACSSDTVKMDDPDIDFIKTADVVFEGLAEGQEMSIEFNSPQNWVAEIHQTGSWLKADKLSGKAGPAKITITPRSNNFGVTSRQATLDVFVDGYQVYTIKIEQKSASTNDLTIEGHINEGTMTLCSDAKGTIFTDTIYVVSHKVWDFALDGSSSGILSFERDGEPKNGEETRIRVVVSADYSKLQQANFEGKFYIRTGEGTAVPINVVASANVGVFANSRPQQDEQEMTSFELKDDVRHGVFSTTFYVDSNVRWTLGQLPSWLETTVENPSNIRNDGTIEKERHPVTLMIKSQSLSVDGKRDKIDILDSRGNVLKSVYIVFAGAGSNYIDYSFSVPANDVNGNPWAFEAMKNTVENEGSVNRRRISLDFFMTTSADYNSISNAPFHLLLVDGTNGIAKKKEMHWATLKMGDTSEQSKTDNGLFVKQLILEANERGDADDKNGVTNPSNIRNAFVFIVPYSIKFDDLWNSDGSLKDEYANGLVLIAQKNDPNALYKFSFEGYADGSKIADVSPAGQTLTFSVTPGSYAQCDFRMEKRNEGTSDWVGTSESECKVDFTYDAKDNPTKATLTFGENVAKYNALKKEWVGSNRDFRLVFTAFINDDAGSKVIYTVYFHQDLKQ